MAQFMTAIGIKIRLMAMEYLSLIMETDMRVNSITVSKKVMGLCSTEMETLIKVNGRMVSFGETAFFILKMGTTMKDNL